MLGERDRRIFRQIEEQMQRDDPVWSAQFSDFGSTRRSSWFLMPTTPRTYTIVIMVAVLLLAASLVLGLGLLAVVCVTVVIVAFALRGRVARAPRTR
jgi:DUF3040 family protein